MNFDKVTAHTAQTEEEEYKYNDMRYNDNSYVENSAMFYTSYNNMSNEE